MDYKNSLYFNNKIACYEIKIFLKILLLKLLRVCLSLVNLGKELKILAPWKAKAFCPVMSLYLGNVSSFFCLDFL